MAINIRRDLAAWLDRIAARVCAPLAVYRIIDIVRGDQDFLGPSKLEQQLAAQVPVSTTTSHQVVVVETPAWCLVYYKGRLLMARPCLTHEQRYDVGEAVALFSAVYDLRVMRVRRRELSRSEAAWAIGHRGSRESVFAGMHHLGG